MPVLALAERVSLVTPEEYLALRVFIENKDKYEYLPKNILKDRLGLSSREVDTILTKLRTVKAIDTERISGEIMFKITFTGIDILAIKSLYAKHVVKSLGQSIGQGKESSVYYGYDFNGELIAIKLHRVGKTSFKNVRKLRELRREKSWISITLDNALNEFSALQCVKSNFGNVPSPLGYAFNAVTMEFIEGVQLAHAELSKPSEVLDKILATIRIAYTYCKIVHSDLSPYN
ncbi:RIO1 family regulatory kinase/ATPase, partial [Acidianus sp. RZ1]|uniref:RIO1 family regulatory kinase/ATPase domain-containing protein n=1 Tax=Acidianus sp. RZ1 TaxID=1540082 RepID=UPI0014915B54